MRKMIILTIFFGLLCKTSICEENLIAEFLDNKIHIDVGFTGEKLSYFGAIDSPGDLVIIVSSL